MVAQKKFDPAEMRRNLLEKGWTILMKYLEHLDDPKLITATDARVGALVVKTLFDSMDKAETGAPLEEEIELPQIPEKILEQIVTEALGKRSVAKTRKPTSRIALPGVPHQPHSEC